MTLDIQEVLLTKEKELRNINEYRIMILKKDIYDKDLKLISLENKLKKIIEDFSFNSAIIKERDDELMSLENEHIHLKNEVLERDEEINKLKYQIECIQSTILINKEKLQYQESFYQNKVLETKNQMESLKQKYLEDIARLRIEAEDNIKKKEIEIKKINDQCNDSRVTYMISAEQLIEEREKIFKLKKKEDELERKKSDNLNINLRKEIQKYQNQLSSADKKIGDLMDESTKLEKENENLMYEIKNLTLLVDKQGNQMLKQKTEIEDIYKKIIEKMEDEMSTLLQSLHKAEGQISMLNTNYNDEIESAVKIKESELARTVENLRSKIREASMNLEKKEAEIQESHKIMQEMRNKNNLMLSNMNFEKELLEEKLQESDNKLNAYIKKTEEKISYLQAELSEKNDNLIDKDNLLKRFKSKVINDLTEKLEVLHKQETDFHSKLFIKIKKIEDRIKEKEGQIAKIKEDKVSKKHLFNDVLKDTPHIRIDKSIDKTTTEYLDSISVPDIDVSTLDRSMDFQIDNISEENILIPMESVSPKKNYILEDKYKYKQERKKFVDLEKENKKLRELVNYMRHVTEESFASKSNNISTGTQTEKKSEQIEKLTQTDKTSRVLDKTEEESSYNKNLLSDDQNEVQKQYILLKSENDRLRKEKIILIDRSNNLLADLRILQLRKDHSIPNKIDIINNFDKGRSKLSDHLEQYQEENYILRQRTKNMNDPTPHVNQEKCLKYNVLSDGFKPISSEHTFHPKIMKEKDLKSSYNHRSIQHEISTVKNLKNETPLKIVSMQISGATKNSLKNIIKHKNEKVKVRNYNKKNDE